VTELTPRNPSRRRYLLTTLAVLATVFVSVAPGSAHAASQGAKAKLRYTHLVHTYTFHTAALAKQWSVYDSSWGGDPFSRVPKLVSVSHKVLSVATKGKSGSGLCLCIGSGLPTKPYGRWDIRAKASANADHGFAMMLWPNAEDWPRGGEIDIAEYPVANRTRVDFTLHYGAQNHEIHNSFSGRFTKWHTYSVEWAPTFIRYRIDGHVLATIRTRAAIPTRPMHLAMQAGADTTGRVSNTSAALDVAWVRVYR
jgi:hypothetical protein